METEHLMIKELTDAVGGGVTPQMVRHYHTLGLLPQVQRSAGNYRFYPQQRELLIQKHFRNPYNTCCLIGLVTLKSPSICCVNRKTIFNRGMIPNIPANPRGRMSCLGNRKIEKSARRTAKHHILPRRMLSWSLSFNISDQLYKKSATSC
jgi:MerR family regulatory protein